MANGAPDHTEEPIDLDAAMAKLNLSNNPNEYLDILRQSCKADGRVSEHLWGRLNVHCTLLSWLLVWGNIFGCMANVQLSLLYIMRISF